MASADQSIQPNTPDVPPPYEEVANKPPYPNNNPQNGAMYYNPGGAAGTTMPTPGPPNMATGGQMYNYPKASMMPSGPSPMGAYNMYGQPPNGAGSWQTVTTQGAVIVTQPTTFGVVLHEGERPNTTMYTVLSALSCFFCNCICGLVALVLSFRASSAANFGDYRQARGYRSTIIGCNIAALICGIIIWGVVIAAIAINMND